MQIPGAVLPNAGVGQAIDFSAMMHGIALGNEQTQQNIRNKRLKQTQQNAETTEFAKEFDPASLSGDPGDPAVGASMADMNTQAAKLFAKGASQAEVRTQLAPQIAKIKQYMVNTKAIDTQIEQMVKGLPKDAGYDMDAIKAEAKKMALTDGINDDGSLILKDPSKIDTTQNYVMRVVREHPELVTNMNGWDKYLKELPKQTSSGSVTAITGPGKSEKYKVKTISNYLEGVEQGEDGKMSLAPSFEVAQQDDGKGGRIPITDPETGKPMRLLSTPVFDNLLQKNPHLADGLRGETKRHFIAVGQPDIAENDPKFKMYAQALAYKAIASNSSSTIESNKEDKESAAAVKADLMKDPNYRKDLYDAARIGADARYDSEVAHEQGKGQGTKAEKESAPESVAQIFTDPATAISGADIKETPDGKQAYDILSLFPKGGLRFKQGPGGSYTGGFYDPTTHNLLLYKKGSTEPQIVTSKNAGQFMTQIAEANGIPKNQVKKTLDQYKFSSGAFDQGKDDDLAKPVQEAQAKVASEKVDKKLNAFVSSESGAKLKGIKVADGEVTDGSIRGGLRTSLGADKFSIKIKTPAGKTIEKTFKTQDDLSDYLKGSTASKSSAILD